MSIFDVIVPVAPAAKVAKTKTKVALLAGPFEVNADLTYGIVAPKAPYPAMLHVMPRNAKPFNIGLERARRVAACINDGDSRSK